MTPGRRIAFVTTKWGDRPHWRFEATYLGADRHGHWVGIPPGTSFRRPGMEFTGTNTQVTLVPRENWWVATFHGDDGPPRPGWAALGGAPVEVYADMTTPSVWDADSVRTVDLDLDVLRGTTGVVAVDDEDEFAAHQVAYAYPKDVVAAARAACEEVRRLAEERVAPFDGAAPRVWLDRVGPP